MSQDTYNENMGAGHISTKHYIIGFVLAILLTGASFAFAMIHFTSLTWPIIGLSVAAILQMLVHLHYFLHLDKSSEQRWNVLALAFTALLLFIFVAGTMWVMYTLNSRMM